MENSSMGLFPYLCSHSVSDDFTDNKKELVFSTELKKASKAVSGDGWTNSFWIYGRKHHHMNIPDSSTAGHYLQYIGLYKSNDLCNNLCNYHVTG
jgi:hypothetical protein